MDKMLIFIQPFIFILLLVSVRIPVKSEESPAHCGCQELSPCFVRLMSEEQIETLCPQISVAGTATISVFLKLLNRYCSDIFNMSIHSRTYEQRNLYEVVIGSAVSSKSVIVLEAGQSGGKQAVGLALHVLHQLVACQENRAMLDGVTWLMLPSSNPDGLEISRHNRPTWRKNARLSDNRHSYGVDITRNFDVEWGSCDVITSIHSPQYPGPYPFSENESRFIRDVLVKYNETIKLYVSIRRDGHSMLYPFAYSDKDRGREKMKDLASKVALQVNKRAGHIQTMRNYSILEQNGGNQCGHSVDYALYKGVPMAFEMRVFLGTNGGVVGKFFNLPVDYEATLMTAYFDGIKEMYAYVIRS